MVSNGYVSSFVAGVHEIHDAFVAEISAEISCCSRKGEGDRYQTMSLNVSMKHDSIYNGIYVSATVPRDPAVTCRRESRVRRRLYCRKLAEKRQASPEEL